MDPYVLRCGYVHVSANTCGSQERAADTPEWELQTPEVCAGKWTHVFKEKQTLLITKSHLQNQIVNFARKIFIGSRRNLFGKY